MNSENGKEKEADGNPEGISPVNFERTLEHLKAGHENAQNVIKFIDTKTSFLFGASIVTMGFILQAAKQYSQLPPAVGHAFNAHPYHFFVLIIIGQLSLLAGGLCIWSCAMSLIPRHPAKKLKRTSMVLFPFFEGKPSERQFCSQAGHGLTDREILREYEAQIWSLGLILRKKIIRHRRAVIMFLTQIIIVAAGGLVVLSCLQN